MRKHDAANCFLVLLKKRYALQFMEWWIFPLIGAFGGFLAGLGGLGGGIIISPLLVLTLQDPLQAVATSLASMTVPTSISAYLHSKQRSVDFSSYRKMFPGVLIGSFLGAYIAKEVNQEFLRNFFGVFLLLISFFFLIGVRKIPSGSKKIHKSGELFLFGLGCASLASFMGIGGGVIATIYYFLSGISIKTMLGLTAMVSMSISFIGALPLLNQVNYLCFLGIAPVSALFAYLGFRTAKRIEGNVLEKILGMVLFSLGIVLLYPILSRAF
ncbi:sulfite exporter TauE/SafE family protein [bacterium]|nr:sulfite exporter TauE/SafE family protein [bacterium]